MKEETIGGILVSWRKKQGKFIADCANELNAPIEYLDAIENNSFSELPNDPYTFNLIDRYAQFIQVKDEDSKKIRILAKQLLNISDSKPTRKSYLKRGWSIIINISFIFMLLVCAIIIYDEEFYGRDLLKNIKIVNHEKIASGETNHLEQNIDSKVLELDINESTSVEYKQQDTKKFTTMEIQVRGDVWFEIIDNKNTTYISRNFRTGERYLFNFKGNEILLTDNPSNILIIYNEKQISLAQMQTSDVVEIDLKSIIF